MSTNSINKIFGAALLVAGTCIGAGMLALPVSTAAAGFYPSIAVFVFCWLMMILSAFLMLEVSLWYPEETNLITMAKSTLGTPGKILAWFTYVLFFYALMTAYTSGAAGIIAKGLSYFGISEDWGIWILVSIFASIVYLGARSVDWVNRWLMLVLIGSYLALVMNVVPKVSSHLLSGSMPKYLWTTGPLLVTSFGFHLLIPTLKNYLHHDVKSLRLAILFGSIIPLMVYILWELLVLGTVPVSGERGLVAILHAEHTTGKQAVIELTQLLSEMLHNPKITFFARSFGLCAILTSFIGVAIGLFDFFADGLHIKKTAVGRLWLAFLTFLPPILFAIFYPRFIIALHYAGIFAAILLIILPALMAWSGRYRLQATGYRVWGGKPLVLIILLFGLAVIVLEVFNRLGLLPTPLTQMHLFY